MGSELLEKLLLLHGGCHLWNKNKHQQLTIKELVEGFFDRYNSNPQTAGLETGVGAVLEK